MKNAENVRIFAGSSNPDLSKMIARILGMRLGNLCIQRFKDGEIRLRYDETVRGKDVFIIQSTCPPVNENLMELLLSIDAAKRASAGRITAVIPYFGYARQDRKDAPRVPISAKLVADLISVAGAHRLLSMDLHVDQLQGFFNIPVDHIFARSVHHQHFRKKGLNWMVVSPDAGGVDRSRNFAESLGVPLAIIDKRRPGPNQADIMHIVGNVKGYDAILFDDIVDTGGSVCKGADALFKAGARSVSVACTHAVFSGDAPKRLQESRLSEVVVTDTIPVPPGRRFKKLTIVSVANLMAAAIARIHEHRSFQAFFKKLN